MTVDTPFVFVDKNNKIVKVNRRLASDIKFCILGNSIHPHNPKGYIYSSRKGRMLALTPDYESINVDLICTSTLETIPNEHIRVVMEDWVI